MDDLQEGISSPDVQKFQKLINEYYLASVVPESGEFDDTTTDGVKRFQKDVKLRVTGIVDAATKKLLAHPPTEKAHKFTIGGQEVVLSEEEYKNALKALAKAAKPIIDGYKSHVAEVRNIWDAHDKVRKDTFFLIPAMVDLWAGTTLPPEGVIKAAENAVANMEKACNGGSAEALSDAIEKGQKPIEVAVTGMLAYREAFYTGGDKLVDNLETLKEGCVDILEVSAAIATGGSSVAVTAGVMAALGGYKATLDQIDKASTDPKLTAVDAFGNVLVSAAVDGTVGALLHDDAFMGKLTSSLGKALAEGPIKKFGNDVAMKIAEKAVKNGLDKAIEAALKDLVESFKPGSKMTMDKAIKDITEELLKGAAYGGTCGAMEKEIDAFTKSSIKYLKPYTFKGLGKVDTKKALDKGGEKIIEAAMKRIGTALILKAADKPSDMKDIGDDLAKAIAADKKVNDELADLVKKQKLT